MLSEFSETKQNNSFPSLDLEFAVKQPQSKLPRLATAATNTSMSFYAERLRLLEVKGS